MQEFLALYQALNRENIHRIGEIYTEDIHFIDPAHEIRGLDKLRDYFEHLYANVEQIEFDFIDHLVDGDRGFVRWSMKYSHPRLKGGQAITVPGSSFLQFVADGRVCYHQDYFDLGSMLYQHLPIIGFMVKSINRRLGT